MPNLPATRLRYFALKYSHSWLFKINCEERALRLAGLLKSFDELVGSTNY